MTVTLHSQEDGTFEGTGAYPTDGPYTHTWTVEGTVDDNTVSFDIVYLTGNPDYKLSATGTIAPE